MTKEGGDNVHRLPVTEAILKRQAHYETFAATLLKELEEAGIPEEKRKDSMVPLYSMQDLEQSLRLFQQDPLQYEDRYKYAVATEYLQRRKLKG